MSLYQNFILFKFNLIAFNISREKNLKYRFNLYNIFYNELNKRFLLDSLRYNSFFNQRVFNEIKPNENIRFIRFGK